MQNKKKISLLLQIAILFIVGVILIGALSAYALYGFTTRYVRERLETQGKQLSEELGSYLMQYPSYEWLCRYWYAHYAEMDVEYDAIYTNGTVTEEKYVELIDRNPTLYMEYATPEDLDKLPPEDQKLFAEIVYSWTIDRVDYAQSANNLDYLFCIVTDEPYDERFLLFIGADEGEERGNKQGQVYPFGKLLATSKEQQEAIRLTVEGKPQSALNRNQTYYDYYYYLTSFDGHEVILVQTMDVTRVNDAIAGRLYDLGNLFATMLIALSLICLFMIYALILVPLQKVQKNIDYFKDTKNSQIVMENLSNIRSHNEIAELSGDVAAMVEELTVFMKQNEENAVREEHNKTELELASRIQKSMLPAVFPPYPERTDFEIYASMTPAKQVGGDFYEFFLVDESHLCLMIADVSGKGIPAALFMMASKILLEHNAKMNKPLTQVLTDVNNAICNKNPEGMFITIWIGILDLATGKMTCANAGHQYPVLKKPGGRYELIKDQHDLVVGVVKDVQYHAYTLEMEPGSALFLYTDGLSEATDPEQRMFGLERILDELNRDPDRSAEKVLCDMKDAVDAWARGSEQFDDLTLLGITYQGPDAKKKPAKKEPETQRKS